MASGTDAGMAANCSSTVIAFHLRKAHLELRFCSGRKSSGIDMKATMVLLLLLASASADAGTDANGEPYGIKGVTLGLTLDEFKSVPVPENVGFASEIATRKEFRLPPLKRSFFPDCGKTTGLIKCKWMQVDDDGLRVPGQQRTPFANGSGYFEFTFAQAADGQHRLAMIDVQSNMVQFDNLIAAYRARYGSPQEGSVAVQNGYGATFDQQVFTWTNAVDKIEMRTLCGRADHLCISYARLSLQADVKRAKESNAAKAPSDF